MVRMIKMLHIKAAFQNDHDASSTIMMIIVLKTGMMILANDLDTGKVPHKVEFYCACKTCDTDGNM